MIGRGLQLLFKGIEAGEGLIIVYSVRRVGKTSLVYVGLSELDTPFIPIDVRKFLTDPSFLSPQILLGVVGEVLKRYESYQGRIKDFLSGMLEYVESLECPFCKKEALKTVYYPQILQMKESRSATAGTKTKFYHTKEI